VLGTSLSTGLLRLTPWWPKKTRSSM